VDLVKTYLRQAWLLTPLLLAGCISDPLSVTDGGGMTVQVHVTGGLAGADYTVLLDGSERQLIGEECVNLCDFQDGEVLQNLTPSQVDYIWGLFNRAAILQMDGQDFGTQCCDQFYFEVDYRDPDGRSRVRGTSGVFPDDLKPAVGAVLGLASGTLPIIVNFDTNPTVWPADGFQIEAASVSGHSLLARISYGGGCADHDVQLVAWGGWMESHPVQVKLFLSHEDHDDPCDAWITEDFTFDLVPLKIAYEQAYGVAAPGTTTLILQLADPRLASPLGARTLEYVF
jgi:hypothetical protein